MTLTNQDLAYMARIRECAMPMAAEAVMVEYKNLIMADHDAISCSRSTYDFALEITARVCNLQWTTGTLADKIEEYIQARCVAPDAIRPSESAKEIATKLFDGVALRVDQFFKAKTIQGGVRCGEDMFSAIDTLELSKSIERYAQGRADAIRRELDLYKNALLKVIGHTGTNQAPSNELLKGLLASIFRIANDAIMNAGKE
jgi:hypothetical protein